VGARSKLAPHICYSGTWGRLVFVCELDTGIVGDHWDGIPLGDLPGHRPYSGRQSFVSHLYKNSYACRSFFQMRIFQYRPDGHHNSIAHRIRGAVRSDNLIGPLACVSHNTILHRHRGVCPGPSYKISGGSRYYTTCAVSLPRPHYCSYNSTTVLRWGAIVVGPHGEHPGYIETSDDPAHFYNRR
jgi:hypothetical protein